MGACGCVPRNGGIVPSAMTSMRAARGVGNLITALRNMGHVRAAANIAAVRGAFGDHGVVEGMKSVASSYARQFGLSSDDAFAQLTSDLEGTTDPFGYLAPHVAYATTSTLPGGNPPFNRTPVPGIPPMGDGGAPGPTDSCGRKRIAPCVPDALCGAQVLGVYALETSALTAGVMDNSNGAVSFQLRGTDIASLQQLGTMGAEATRIAAAQVDLDASSPPVTSVGGAPTTIVTSVPEGRESIGFYVEISTPGDDNTPGTVTAIMSSANASGLKGQPIDRSVRTKMNLPREVSFFIPWGIRYADSDAAGAYQTQIQTDRPVELTVEGLPSGLSVEVSLLMPGTDAWDYFWASVYNFGLAVVS